MPKKLTLSDLDFSRDDNQPDWVEDLRRQNEEQRIAREAMRSSSVDEANVESPVLPSATPVVQEESFWDRDKEQREQLRQGLIGSGERFGAGLIETGSRLYEAQFGDIPEQGKALSERVTQGLRDDAGVRAKELQEFRESLKTLSPVEREVGTALADIVESAPSSAPSLIGGPFGMLAVEDVYAQTYHEAINAGVPEDEAEAYALAQAAPELISVIPAGKAGMAVLKKLPIIGPRIEAMTKKATTGLAKKLLGPNQRIAARIAATAVGEAGEEVVTGSLQDLMSAAAAGTARSEELRALADSQTPKSMEEFLESRKREAVAGGLMGVGGGTVSATTATAEFNRDMDNQSLDNMEAADKFLGQEVEAVDNKLNEEIAKEERRIQTEEDFDRMEREEAQRKADEEEAGFRTMERQKNISGEGTLAEPLRKAGATVVTPEQVAAERKAKEDAVAEQQADQVALNEQLAKDNEEATLRKEIEAQQNARKKALEKKTKDEQAKAKKEQEARRKEVMAQVVEENPDATPDELLPLVKQRLEAPVEAPKADTEVAPVLPTPKKAEAPAAAPVEGQVTDDAEIQELRDAIGLESDTTPAKPKLSKQESDAKRLRVIDGITRKNTNPSVDVQNLVRQGKLIVAHNAEEVGIPETGAQGLYHKGKMYLFTDNASESNPVGDMLYAALHEPVHTGQFNYREGRSRVMQELFSPEMDSKVNTTIRKAAENGNKIAQLVIEDAKKAQKKADKAGVDAGNLTIEGLELAPYLATRVAQARDNNTSIGQLGSAVRDMIAAAKSVLRDKVGIDLDVSINDLIAVSQKAAGEIVKTDIIEPISSDGTTLEMIGGESATGYNAAIAGDRVYVGKVDRLPRFEFSDHESSIDTDALDNLKRARQNSGMQLGSLLNHEELYKQYPQLRDYDVIIDKSINKISENANGYFSGGANKVLAISTKVANNLKEARSVLLHEIQHAIQEIEGLEQGANPKQFENPAIADAYNREKETYDEVFKELSLSEDLRTLPESVRADFNKELRSLPFRTVEAAKDLFYSKYASKSTDMGVRNIGEDYKEVKADFDQATKALDEDRRKAFEQYLKVYGEAEARTTQLRRDMDDDERQLLTPEADMKFAKGKVKVEDTIASPNSRRDVISDSSASVADGLPILESAAVEDMKTAEKGLLGKLFDASKRRGEFNEIIEFAQSSPSEIRMKAMRDERLFDAALRAEARTRNTDAKTLGETIQRELEEATKNTDGYNESFAAFKAVADKYSKAGEVLVSMRNSIDALTKNIIKQRLQQGKLTTAERKLYITLADNLGRYTHRQYASMIGGTGNKYSKIVWDDYNKVKKNKGQGTEAQLENYKRVDNAIKFLIEDGIAIPDNTELARLNADQINRLYSVWQPDGHGNGMTMEEKRVGLSKMRNQIGPERINNTAEALSKEILGLGTRDNVKEIVTYYRGGKQDDGILKSRKQVPLEIRELLGEIKDPGMRMMVTAAKQAEFIARNRMLVEIANKIGPDVQPPNAVGTDAVKDLVQLEAEGYGPLRGYWVSNDLRNTLNDNIIALGTLEDAVALAGIDPSASASIATHKAIIGIGKAAGLQKRMNIVLKPANYAFNYVGAYAQMLNNGNINPKYWARAHKAAGQLILASVNSIDIGPLAIEANKYGITDSAFVGELKAGQHRELLEMVNKMAGKSPSQIAALWHASGRATGEFYAMMDVWSKLANFYMEVDFLTDVNKAEGSNKSVEQIKREAADRTNATNITYKRSLSLFKAAEKAGFTQFANYFYEVYRSQINNALLGVGDINRARTATTPEARRMYAIHGAKRLGGQALVWYGMSQLTKALAHSLGDDEDDWKLKYLLPEFIREQDFLPLGKDESGNMIVWDLSRVDPIGPITDLMRAAAQPDADIWAIKDQIVDLYILPRFIPAAAKAAWGTFIDPSQKASETLTEQLAPDLWGATNNALPSDERVNRLWLSAGEKFLPGWSSALKPSNPEPVKGDMAEFGQVLRAMGTTLYSVDPDKAVKFAAFDYKDSVDLARRDAKDVLKSNPEGLTQEELAGRIGGAQERQREAFTNLHNVVTGLRQHGKTEREITLMLKNLNLSADDIRAAKNGEFVDTAITRKSLQATMQYEMRGKSSEEKKEIREKWQNIMMLLQEGGE